jgi:3-isopropylmalate/(R)-2-methylmalate dehydratase small subunit
MPQFTTLTSRIVLLTMDNIDTDQIIPARYLKVTGKAGLGDALFADWRYTSDGAPRPEFVLNRPENRGAQILFAGDNFGCGSSREHAPWALIGYGFRAIISTSFADIFRNNALKNGLLPIIVDADTHARLLAKVKEMSDIEATIDLTAQTLTFPGSESKTASVKHDLYVQNKLYTITFPIDSFSKTCLLNGIDELGYILRFSDQIAAYES